MRSGAKVTEGVLRVSPPLWRRAVISKPCLYKLVPLRNSWNTQLMVDRSLRRQSVSLAVAWAMALLAVGLPPTTTAHAATFAMQESPAAVPQAPLATPPPGLPGVMHWCAKHCMTLVWQNDHYTSASAPGSNEWILDSFTRESFVMRRTDYQVKGGETVVGGKAVLSGRISEQGDTVADGKITWMYHPCCGTGTATFTAAWGAALDTVPGSDEERDRQQAASTFQPMPQTQSQVTVAVVLDQDWTDTGVYLRQSQSVKVTARGTMNWYTGACDGKCLSTPAGIPCPGGGPMRLGLPCLSLLGRIGKGGRPFEVGGSVAFTANTSGEFFLGVNDEYLPDNTGAWTATISSPSIFAQVKARQQTTLSVVLDHPWTDTGVYLAQGQPVTITARGTMNWYTGSCDGKCLSTPAGIPCPGGGPKRLGLTCLSLIGLIGVSGRPFYVGDSLTFSAPAAGELFLGVNDDNVADNTGEWTATISSPIAFVQWAQAGIEWDRKGTSPSVSGQNLLSAFLKCALMSLGEAACKKQMEQRLGPSMGGLSCATLLQTIVDGRIDPTWLIIGAMADSASDSKSEFWQTAGGAAKFVLFSKCMADNQ